MICTCSHHLVHVHVLYLTSPHVRRRGRSRADANVRLCAERHAARWAQVVTLLDEPRAVFATARVAADEAHGSGHAWAVYFELHASKWREDHLLRLPASSLFQKMSSSLPCKNSTCCIFRKRFAILSRVASRQRTSLSCHPAWSSFGHMPCHLRCRD